MENFNYPNDAHTESSEPIDFSALLFSDMLTLQGEAEQYPDSRTKSIITTRVVGRPVRLQDQILLFTMLHQQLADQATNMVVLEKYEFCLQENENEDEFVDCTIMVKYKTADGKIIEGFSEATLFKQTKNSKGVFSRGIGIQFYKKALDFIASLAIERGIHINDIVKQGSAVQSPHGQGGLTNEQWERTFMPVMTDYGYTKINPNKGELTFVKKYKPLGIEYHR